MITAESSKVTGKTINAQEEDTKNTKTALSIKAILIETSLMAKASTSGAMAKYMRGSGKLALNTDMESGKAPKMIRMLGNGISRKLVGMESIYGLTVISMKASLKIISSMATARNGLPMVTYTREHSRKASHMDLAF